MRVAGLQWAQSNVPRTAPEPEVPLPSLLDDPPGRALVASYAPRPAEGLGFAGEAIEFYRADGRWRRLELGDLDLPEEGWAGSDTYGAGALSPDGRWWAGTMEDGMFLVDLRDGGVTVQRPPFRTRGTAEFEWSPDSDELVLSLTGRTLRVSIPGLELEPFPLKTGPSLLADGSWVDCPAEQGRITACTSHGADGAVIAEQPIPEDLVRRNAGPADQVGDVIFYNLPGGPTGNTRRDSEIVRTDTDFEPNARLILPAGSEINWDGLAFHPGALELQSFDRRLLLAWLVDEERIVKLIRPGVGNLATSRSQDHWDVSFARDLVEIG